MFKVGDFVRVRVCDPGNLGQVIEANQNLNDSARVRFRTRVVKDDIVLWWPGEEAHFVCWALERVPDDQAALILAGTV